MILGLTHFSLSCFFAVNTVSQAAVRVEATADAKAISLYAPVLIHVKVTNIGQAVEDMRLPLWEDYQNIVVCVRPPQSEWREVIAGCAISSQELFPILHPGRSVETFVGLFGRKFSNPAGPGNGQRRVFDAPGKWQVKVGVIVSKHWVYCQPFDVEVEPRIEKSTRRLDRQGVMPGVVDFPRDASPVLAKPEPSEGDGVAGRWVRAIRLLADLREKGLLLAGQNVRDEWNQFKSASPPPQRRYFDLLEAEMYAQKGFTADAERLIRDTAPGSLLYASVMSNIYRHRDKKT